VQKRPHWRDLAVVHHRANGVVAHDGAAQRRVADEEASVDGDRPLEAAEPVPHED
jgi:hypothetical protein